MGLLSVGTSESLILMPPLGPLFLMLVYHVQHGYDCFCFISIYFVLFGCYFLEDSSFPRRGKIWWIQRGGGEELGLLLPKEQLVDFFLFCLGLSL